MTDSITIPTPPWRGGMDDDAIKLLRRQALDDQELLAQLPSKLADGLCAADTKLNKRALIGIFLWKLDRVRIKVAAMPVVANLADVDPKLLGQAVGAGTDRDLINQLLDSLWTVKRAVENVDAKPFVSSGYTGRKTKKVQARHQAVAGR